MTSYERIDFLGRDFLAVQGLSELRSRTALLAIAPLYLLWAVVLILAVTGGLFAGEYSIRLRLFSMVSVLTVLSFFSMVPVLIWGAFTTREKTRLKEAWASELQSHGWSSLSTKVSLVIDFKYDGDRYRVPLFFVSWMSVFGWTILIFSDGLNPIAKVVATGELKGFIVGLGGASPVAFGFLGAYYFTITMLVRGYLRLDLSPELFTQVAQRMLIIVILVFVLQSVWGYLTSDGIGTGERAALIIVAFVGGTVPTLITDFLERSARSILGAQESNVGAPYLSIGNIEGVYPLQEERLQAAGIEDIENLAMADIPETMVNARLGSFRLVDWIDQALIRLYSNDKFDRLHSEYGIRTATSFILAYYGDKSQDWPKDQFDLDVDPVTPVFEGEADRSIRTWAMSIIAHPNFREIQILRLLANRYHENQIDDTQLEE